MKSTTTLAATATFLGGFPTWSQAVPYNAHKIPATKSWVKFEARVLGQSNKAGQPIKIRLTATNTHSSGAYLTFSSGQRFDFSVFRVGQKESSYTWSASRMFTQSLGTLWLKPGATEVYEAELGQEMGTLPAGKYVLQAHLTRSPQPIAAEPVFFTIEEANPEPVAKP